MLLVIGVAIFFFGCEKDFVEPDPSMDTQETAVLKSAKVKVEFTGTCVPLGPNSEVEPQVLPNGRTKQFGVEATWYDDASDGRVTGKTFWCGNYFWEGAPFASNAKIFGKTELLVDDPNNDDPDAPHIGKWDMTWHGYLTFTPDGNMIAICDAVGTGKEGVVKGLTAKWVYTLDLNNTGFQYLTVGYIK